MEGYKELISQKLHGGFDAHGIQRELVRLKHIEAPSQSNVAQVSTKSRGYEMV